LLFERYCSSTNDIGQSNITNIEYALDVQLNHMIKIISSVTGSLYRGLAKPVLFKFPADNVHHFFLKAGIITQSIPLVTKILRLMWRFDSPKLNQTIAGIEFKNPLGLSAGFDKEARLPKLVEAIGFGQVEVGSITAMPYGGNKKPWYSRLKYTKSILVNSGLRSSGVIKIADKADKLSKNTYNNIVVNASIAKTNSPECNTVEKGIEDYCKSLIRLEKSPWPKLYTINISCPNTSGGEPFNKPENLAKLLVAIDNLNLKRPVFLKLPINLPWETSSKLVAAAANSKLTGLTIGNLSKDRSLVDSRDTLTDEMRGHLSGKPCWDASNLLLAKCYATYGDRFVYSGVGGVFSAEDAYKKIKLGASLIEMITGLIFNGPTVVGEINRRLVELLEKDGYNHISEAVGVDSKKYIKGDNL
jgi:dihydroorotate dehydrogenase